MIENGSFECVLSCCFLYVANSRMRPHSEREYKKIQKCKYGHINAQTFSYSHVDYRDSSYKITCRLRNCLVRVRHKTVLRRIQIIQWGGAFLFFRHDFKLFFTVFVFTPFSYHGLGNVNSQVRLDSIFFMVFTNFFRQEKKAI